MADVVLDLEKKNSRELLALGIKAYVLQDYEASVAALSKASELLVLEHKDDLHDSLGVVYLHYGKALLGLSRDQSNVLGDAVPKENEDSDEEAGENSDDADEEPEKVEEEAECSHENDENTDDKVENTEESSENADEKGESTDVKTENEDDASDLQLAWEVLELAKKIYQRQGDAGKKHLAETFVILGEISLESENFSAAIEDITQGLEIQKILFESDSRIVAETYYKLGIAYSTDSQIDKSIESFIKSIEYLKNRVEKLDKIEDKKDEVVEEIKEIKSLIPDIEEKIVDMKTYKDEENRIALQQLVSAVTKAQAGESSVSSTSGASSSKTSDKVNDISHLVKKKRKLEDVDEKEEKEVNPPKKPTK